MFRKNPEAVNEWSPNQVLVCAKRQSEILHNAAQMLMPGGNLVYSTCTFSKEENEDVIKVLLPTDIWTVNPSFFGGLFEQSIKNYHERLWDKYRFLYTDSSELSESVRASIEYDFDYVLTHME